jgi:hypothetical protein
VLYAANLYVDWCGHSIEAESLGEDEALAGLASLGLMPDDQKPLIEQFRAEYEAIAQFYQ